MLRAKANDTRLAPRETRVSTRDILRHIIDDRKELANLAGKRLHEGEVAAFIVKLSKCMWFAATAAELKGLVRIIEPLFFEAFLCAGGDLSQALNAAHEENVSEDQTTHSDGGAVFHS